MIYNPEISYRCTIIRGKSQTDLEDLLPLYANMVHKYCPATEAAFKQGCRRDLSRVLFGTNSYETLSRSNQKTVDNHLTEIAGTLLGLYYPSIENGTTYINESASCKYLFDFNDFPTFFKNLCLNFQFTNGAKSAKYVQEDIDNNIHLKPFCYVVALLYYAQSQQAKEILTKQEIGYYALNSLEVLQGNVPPEVVYDQIMSDRKNGVKRSRLSGSHDWQHIKEQFNLLELTNVVECDANYIWLNPQEADAVRIFLDKLSDFGFDVHQFDFNDKHGRENYFLAWKYFYGTFNQELLSTNSSFARSNISIISKDEQKKSGGATKSTVDLGDEGEALVFRIEQERIRNYKERLVNKVILLGKTKGLGYDIASIEATEMPSAPEMARFIEVKSTKRITRPSFDKSWSDVVNLTAKEWIAAQQFGEHYNIYRVYFTKNDTIVVRINNPYKKYTDGDIEVFPTIYQMAFDSSVIELRYDGK